MRYLLLLKDYVRFRLTGERATDMADASGTLLLDVSRLRWSSEMLDAAALEESLLPALEESPDVCAKVSAEGAAASGRCRHSGRRWRRRSNRWRCRHGNRLSRRG